jgi:hypothetical protein
MTATTSVGVTKEASGLLDTIAKETGLSKLYLASTAIQLFFDPDLNPRLPEALSDLKEGRRRIEFDFVRRLREEEK